MGSMINTEVDVNDGDKKAATGVTAGMETISVWD